MVKAKALNDTTYRFSYVAKGTIIEGGNDLHDNVNFEVISGKNDKVAPDANGQGVDVPQAAGKMPYTELCKTAKELGVKFTGVKYDELLTAIAEAQAKAAAPTVAGNDEVDDNAGSAGDGGNTSENK